MSKSWGVIGFVLLPVLGAGSLILNSPTFLFAWTFIFLFNCFLNHLFGYLFSSIHACEWISSLIEEAEKEYKQTGDEQKLLERLRSIDLLMEAYHKTQPNEEPHNGNDSN